MEYKSLLSFAILSGIIGFAAYCASCSAHVWRARNASTSAGPTRRWPGRLGVGLMFAGVIAMLGALALRSATRHEGRLRGEGLVVPRTPDRLQVAFVTTEESVGPGDVLARFSAPDREGEIAALALKQRILAGERQVLLNEAEAPDAQLVHRVQEVAIQRRHFQALLDEMIPARDLVARERLRDARDGRDRVARLDADLDRLARELDQAKVRQEIALRQFARIESLFQKQGATSEEVAEKKGNAAWTQLEVKKLQEQIAHARNQKAQIQLALDEIAQASERQHSTLEREMSSLREALSATADDADPLKQHWADDEARRKALRDARLHQLDLELKQAEAQHEALNRTLVVTAPVAGRLAWRHPAPQSTDRDDALCVLAPTDAFRVRLRLSPVEAEHLKKAASVPLELAEGAERRFVGRLLSTRDLPHDPGHVLAELACDPPADAIGDLAGGESVDVLLLWVPPLYASPLFRIGAVCIAAGIGLRASRWTRRQRRPGEHAHEPEQPSVPAPASTPPDPLLVQFGSAGPLLRTLGCQLRESIRRQDLDTRLLSAIEWNLDRHHIRAVALLAAGLGDDEELDRELDALLRQADAQAVAPASVERLWRILHAVAPERIHPLMHRRAANGSSLPKLQGLETMRLAPQH